MSPEKNSGNKLPNKPIIPNKSSDDDRPEPSEYDADHERVKELKANKPPHHD